MWAKYTINLDRFIFVKIKMKSISSLEHLKSKSYGNISYFEKSYVVTGQDHFNFLPGGIRTHFLVDKVFELFMQLTHKLSSCDNN